MTLEASPAYLQQWLTDETRFVGTSETGSASKPNFVKEVGTDFVVYTSGLPKFRRPTEPTPTGSAFVLGPGSPSDEAQQSDQPPEDEDDEGDAVSPEFAYDNAARIELIARKYAEGRLSAEQQARLAILRARVQALVPRVTVSALDALERLRTEREADQAGLAEAMRKYGP